jgi:hypothetical protein
MKALGAYEHLKPNPSFLPSTMHSNHHRSSGMAMPAGMPSMGFGQPIPVMPNNNNNNNNNMVPAMGEASMAMAGFGQPIGGLGAYAQLGAHDNGHDNSGGHGHSHDNNAGHGHSHDNNGGHGHSHNGQPCQGHHDSASSLMAARNRGTGSSSTSINIGDGGAANPGHGHSHNGKPCQGHGTTSLAGIFRYFCDRCIIVIIGLTLIFLVHAQTYWIDMPPRMYLTSMKAYRERERECVCVCV